MAALIFVAALVSTSAHLASAFMPAGRTRSSLAKLPTRGPPTAGSSALSWPTNERNWASTFPASSVNPASSKLYLSPPSLPSVSLPSGASSDLTIYFLRSLIDAFVPTVASLVVLFFAYKIFNGGGGKSSTTLDGDDSGQLDYYQKFFEPDNSPNSKGSLKGFLSGLKRGSGQQLLGPPEQFLTVTKLNDRYKSYDFALTSAVESKPKALIDYRKRGVKEVIENALSNFGDNVVLPVDSCEELIKAERTLLADGTKLLKELVKAKAQLGELVADDIKEIIGEYQVEEEDGAPSDVGGKEKAKDDDEEEKGFNLMKNPMKNMMKDKKSDSLTKKVGEIEASIAAVEVDFIKDVSRTVAHSIAELKVVSTKDAVVAQNLAKFLMRTQLEGGIGGILKDVQERPLSRIFTNSTHTEGAKIVPRKSLFVVDFPGDVSASRVQFLREEVSAIVRTAKEGDEALVVLQSGGGTVTGYGLAAAQLVRLKKKGVKVTIAVEQVAASGGYMMACTGDKIVASPFAVLGSIGVISDQPNVYERLKREGIEFSTVTAGKYKRTLTPTKKPTKEDFDKSKEDVEQILVLFKDFVAKNRPSLDIDKVATGETWFGDDALELGLCDELKTKDEVILDYIKDDFDAYMLDYDPDMGAARSLSLLPGTSVNVGKGIKAKISSFIGGIIRDVIVDEFGMAAVEKDVGGLEKKYMARDTTHEEFRM